MAERWSGCLDAALEYAAFGWKVVPVNGIRNGRCTCGDKHEDGKVRSIGKHPIPKGWQDLATDDEEIISTWYEQWPEANVGVKLGECSWIIDIEFDGEQGRRAAERLLKECFTPTFSSGRSVHRLFRWSAELPDRAKVDYDGLEIRIGGGGSGVQSVFPPSRHHSGKAYQWLAGLSPHDVDPIEVPEALLLAITNGESIKTTAGTGVGRLPFQRVIREGERNNTMLAWASRWAYRMVDIEHPQDQQDLWDIMILANGQKFAPPLGEGELESIYRSALKYAIGKKRGDNAPDAPPTIYQDIPTEVDEDDTDAPRTLIDSGLRCVNGMWNAGSWSVSIIEDEPPIYRLHVPAFAGLLGGRSLDLTLEQFADPAKVARAILRETRKFKLDRRPRLWASVWGGTKDFDGVAAQLLDEAILVEPDAQVSRIGGVASTLLDAIEHAIESDDPGDGNGHPVRRGDGTVWFRWREFWSQHLRTGGVAPGEPARLAQTIGLDMRADFGLYPSSDTPDRKRRRFCVLTPHHVVNLGKLAEGEAERSLVVAGGF